MYSFLFRNRLGAASFVLLTVIGAASLVGTEENGGLIQKATADIEAQKADFEETIEAMGQTDPTPQNPGLGALPEVTDGDIAFTAEEDLIDGAEGFDPTPKDEFDPEAIAEQGEVVMILNNEPIKE